MPGQRISLKGTNGLAGQLLACDVNVKILRPGGAVLAPDTCMENSGSIGAQTLTMAGTYTIVVNPIGYAVGDVTLALHTVPAATQGVAISGRPAMTVALRTRGQAGTRTVSSIPARTL